MKLTNVRMYKSKGLNSRNGIFFHSERSGLQLSKNRMYEKLYMVYRTIYNAQVYRTDLTAIEMDKVIGTRKAGDREDTPIL